MNYQEAKSYIGNIERAGSDYGIERMRMLLDLLGAPDKNLKFIHVAGTNGKGSVCAYITSVLKEAGYKAGTYNSPSVFCYNERWSVNGEPLCDYLVAKYMTEVKEVIDGENERRLKSADLKCAGLNCEDLKSTDLKSADSKCNEFNCAGNSGSDKNSNDNPLYTGVFAPTAFEIETAVAMLAFKELNCDIAVLETGLGGRWDATNAIMQKEVAVITPIGLDHCALLGNTLGEIAEEKAAIIKGNAVTCAQCDEVMDKIYRPYEIKDGKRNYVSANVRVCSEPVPVSHSLNGQTFLYDGREYKISMLGAHQLQNASIAICAAEVLRSKGWNISGEALRKGLENAVWHARLEVVQNAETRFNIRVPSGKTLVFDGAHNPHGAAALAKAIRDYFAEERVHLVLGMLADKDVTGVVKILAPLADKVTAVTPCSPRALDKSVLKEYVDGYAPCDVCDDTRLAVQRALDGDCTVVILCGSLTHFASLAVDRKS